MKIKEIMTTRVVTVIEAFLAGLEAARAAGRDLSASPR
jgi:hypothetical protein